MTTTPDDWTPYDLSEEFKAKLKGLVSDLKVSVSFTPTDEGSSWVYSPTTYVGTGTIDWSHVPSVGTISYPIGTVYGDPVTPPPVEELIIDVIYRTLSHWDLSNSDVMWVGTSDGEYAATLDDFAELVGSATTSEYLLVDGFVIVGDDWWIERNADAYPDEYHEMMMHRVPAMGTSPRGVLFDHDGGMLVQLEKQKTEEPKRKRTGGSGTMVRW